MRLLKSVRLLIVSVLLLSLLVLPNTVRAQRALTDQNSLAAVKTAFNYEAVTIDSTAGGKSLTSATYNPTVTSGVGNATRATRADCYNQTAQISITWDGTAPTTTIGIFVEQGQSFIIYGYANIVAFRAIRTGSTSSTLKCVYGRSISPTP